MPTDGTCGLCTRLAVLRVYFAQTIDNMSPDTNDGRIPVSVTFDHNVGGDW